MRIVGVLLSMCLFASPAWAEVKRIVVLPPSPANTDMLVSYDELDELEDAMRTTAKKTLDPDEHAIVPRDRMLAAFSKLAGNRHLDCGPSCVAQVAQMLPAELYVTSRVNLQSDRYVAFVQLMNGSGEALSSVVLESVRIRNLAVQFAAKATPFFEQKLKERSPIQEIVSEFNASNALQMHFEPPTGAGKWTLFNAKDKALCDLPCTRWVGANSLYKLKWDTESVTLPIPARFEFDWGKAVRARPGSPSKNILLSPWWMIISIPGLAASGGLGLIGAAYTVFGNFYYGSDRLYSAGLTAGFLLLATGFTYWTVKIVRNLRQDGLQIEPIESPMKAMVSRQQAWAQVVPPARPER